jgi:cell division initiation protein
MSITPVEVRHAQLSRAPLGYSRRATDNLLEAVAQSYEQTWWERADLRDEVERLQAELARFKDMERLLRDTMMSAEKAAEDLRSQSRREYDMLLQEARLKAREIVLEAEAERERIRAEIRRLQTDRSEVQASYRAFLQSALDRLDRELEKPETIAEPAPVEAEAGAEPEVSPAEESTDVSLLRDAEPQDTDPGLTPQDETERPTRVA